MTKKKRERETKKVFRLGKESLVEIPTRVFIVFSGSYEDERIIGVFTCIDDALDLKKRRDEYMEAQRLRRGYLEKNHIEEWLVNLEPYLRMTGQKIYDVTLRRDGLVESIYTPDNIEDQCFDYMDLGGRIMVNLRDESLEMHTRITATSSEVAIVVANERRRKMIAEGKFPENFEDLAEKGEDGRWQRKEEQEKGVDEE